MKLSKNNLYVRWAFFFDKALDFDTLKPRLHYYFDADGHRQCNDIPPTTSLCGLFWRGFVMMPLIFLGLGMLASFLLIMISEVWLEMLIITAFAGSTLSLLFGASYMITWFRGDLTRPLQPWEQKIHDGLDVAKQSFIAVKSTYCPIVTITDEDTPS